MYHLHVPANMHVYDAIVGDIMFIRTRISIIQLTEDTSTGNRKIMTKESHQTNSVFTVTTGFTLRISEYL